MDATVPPSPQRQAEQDARVTAAVAQERGRLGNFIRSRVPDAGEAEDILQDVFFEFFEAMRLPESIEQAGAWLFKVARNRITDRFRKKREEPYPSLHGEGGGDEPFDAQQRWLDTVLPDVDDGPDAALARKQLLAEIAEALAELPEEQRTVFIAHELEGLSFADIAAMSAEAVPLNTLLARKRYAVLALRRRLQSLYDDFNA